MAINSLADIRKWLVLIGTHQARYAQAISPFEIPGAATAMPVTAP